MMTWLSKSQQPKLRVVVADYNRLFREGIMALLRRFDFIESIKGIESGQKLIELHEKDSFDIVVINGSLPDMSSVEATTHLFEICPRTKVIYFSAISDLDGIFQMVEAGATGFLMKNSSLEELCNCF